jgi:hypothetical protein
MDEKQNADLARSLDQIISILRGILIALWAIFGLVCRRSWGLLEMKPMDFTYE